MSIDTYLQSLWENLVESDIYNMQLEVKTWPCSTEKKSLLRTVK